MAVLPIIKYGNPILRMKAAPVRELDGRLQRLIDDMVETMQQAEGIGLAAPQVGESLALIVVDMSYIEENGKPIAFLNPQITAQEGESTMEEGCLSVPEVKELVTRAETIGLKFLTASGEEAETRYSGLLARVLLHEIDHLNGVLFVDRISPVKRKLLSKKLRQIAKQEMNHPK
ncbi:MAG: peptide deformylase [candidate division KSB1 bacterium]|nr:peptide deformylase [candidate division KSB1 bacterium]